MTLGALAAMHWNSYQTAANWGWPSLTRGCCDQWFDVCEQILQEAKPDLCAMMSLETMRYRERMK